MAIAIWVLTDDAKIHPQGNCLRARGKKTSSSDDGEGDLSWGELIFLTSALVEIGYGRDER